jgi:hypothetical protein
MELLFYNWERTEYRSPPPRVPLLFVNVLSRKPCVNSEATVWFLSVITFSFRILGHRVP